MKQLLGLLLVASMVGAAGVMTAPASMPVGGVSQAPVASIVSGPGVAALGGVIELMVGPFENIFSLFGLRAPVNARVVPPRPCTGLSCPGPVPNHGLPVRAIAQ